MKSIFMRFLFASLFLYSLSYSSDSFCANREEKVYTLKNCPKCSISPVSLIRDVPGRFCCPHEKAFKQAVGIVQRNNRDQKAYLGRWQKRKDNKLLAGAGAGAGEISDQPKSGDLEEGKKLSKQEEERVREAEAASCLLRLYFRMPKPS